MNLEKIYNELEKLHIMESEKEQYNDILKEIKTEILCNGKIKTGIISSFKKATNMNKNWNKYKENILRNKDGHYVCSNGYFAIEWNNFEDIPKELQSYVNEEIEPVDLIFDKLTGGLENTSKEIDIKKVKQIYKLNKLHKKDNKALLLNFNDVLLDTNLIILILGILGKDKEEKISMIYDKTQLNAPIRIVTENYRVMLLPIRYSEERIKQNSELENEWLN
jgi:D-Tyr-tRNAtyr deacylase